MINVIKEMLLDFQEFVLPVGMQRRVALPQLRGKASVCIGVRRAGKSTLLFQRMNALLDAGVSKENILYVNFFDDRLHGLDQGTIGLITEAYFSLYPAKKNSETVYCFFDEIQMVPGWEPYIDRLLRGENCEVYITGSSARMLSREIATQMRGRALSSELFPFSFDEFLEFRGIENAGAVSAKKRFMMQQAFEAYWECGGFPEVLDVDRMMRIRIHQEYFHAMLFRDIVERHDVSHPRALADIAHWLVDNIAAQYSINNLAGWLKSLGHKVPKPTVSDWLAWFEDAYVFFTVRIFDSSLARANTNPKKVYCIDHAFVGSINSGILVNSGHLLENLVFIALRRGTPDIHYYKTKSGREVDFIIGRAGFPRRLVQVCESMTSPRTRDREVSALSEAMSELGLGHATIVTRSEEERIQLPEGSIDVLPAWRFLLSLSEQWFISSP